MIKQTIHAISLCLLLFFTSCTKSTEEKQWQAEISENKAASLKDIFLQNGSEKLIAIIASKDEVKMSNLNKIGITKEFIDNPEGIIILGLFYAEKEHQDASLKIKSNSTEVMNTPDPSDCFWQAVTGVIGIADAKNIWKALSVGASEETVIAAVRLIGKRVAITISITYMVIQIGDCYGWWGE